MPFQIPGLTDDQILRYVLEGLERDHQKIMDSMTDLSRRLGRKPPKDGLQRPAAPLKPRISKEGRERIAAAQRARWAKAKAATKLPKNRRKTRPTPPVSGGSGAPASNSAE